MRSPVFAILSVLALVASACGPNPSSAPAGGANNVTVATPAAAQPTSGSTAAQPTTGATAAQPTTGGTTAAQPTAAAAPRPNVQPTGAQEITVNALQGEPDNLDPNRSSFATEAAVIRPVFETLLTFDKDLRPAPGASTSFDVSADGKTYTFHLKPDGKWSDGQPVTAKQFEYSLKRILNPDTAAEYASFFADSG